MGSPLFGGNDGAHAHPAARTLATGTSYRWKVRTVDTAGRIGGYRASPATRLARIQDSRAEITYAGSWHAASTSAASGGTERYTSSAGASATVTVGNVRAFAIVGPRSSHRGSFRVYVDGALVATVSERSAGSTTSHRRVLYARSVTSGPGVTHTISLVAVGNGRIDLDAFLTLATP